jgi:hypothetical protein
VADVLRIVTFSAGGRPIETLNLNSAPGSVTAYFRERGSFQFTPAASTVQYSKTARRYGGGRAVGEVHDNGSIAWTAYVRGTTLLAATQNVEALLAAISDEARGRYVEWAPEGGQSSFFEIAGPGSWTPTYDPIEFVQTNAMRVQLAFPVLPLVRWAPMTITDPFDIDSRGDYTFDAGVFTDVQNGSGGLVPFVGLSLASERRARHTARGYDLLEGQATVKTTPLTTITGYKMGVLLRASVGTASYVEVYIDDNGTNSRLRIDVVIVGIRTNRASTNLAARLTSGTAATVRGRIEGNVVTAEYFITSSFAPSPMVAPTLTNNYTLVVGDAPLNTAAGKSGWSWIPQNAGAVLDDFQFWPYTYRNQAFPKAVVPTDPIPGTAPALANVNITTLGAAANPIWAMIAWGTGWITSTATNLPIACIEAELAPISTNWTSQGTSGATAGFLLRDATVSGVETYTADIPVDGSALPPDDFSDNELSVEIWARMELSPTLVAPNIVTRVFGFAGSQFGGVRYTNEYGAIGYTPVLPSATAYRFTKLGTVSLPSNRLVRRSVLIDITVTTGAGSTGTIGLDQLVVVPSRARALSPTGKPSGSTFPSFAVSTQEVTKTVLSNLSATVGQPSDIPMPDHGLGGSLIEPGPGSMVWLVKLSSIVPDDPTSSSGSDPVSISATISIDVTPRSFMLRST